MMKEEDYEKAIKLSQRYWSTMKKVGVKPPNIVGHIGELLVMRELKKVNMNFEPAGGQARYDVLLTDKPQGEGRLEVRTSTLKDWYGVSSYGWVVLRRRSKTRTYDFLVCIAIKSLLEALDDQKFYIFKGNEALSSLDVEDPWLSSVQKRLHIFKNMDEFMVVKRKLVNRGKEDNLTDFDRKVNENLENYLNAWDVLR